MDIQDLYNKNFYDINRYESYKSAKIILNIFKDFFMPQSVFDFGCGVGTWLRAWQDLGVKDIYGIDANTMDNSELLIPREKIGIVNFEEESFEIGKFDLAMSLECLEHISENKAIQAVDILSFCSDIILFSAAIPMQIGTNHINCRPLQYWVDIFKFKGFSCYDFIRPICIKYSLKVAPWYIQNILVFARGEKAVLLESRGEKPLSSPVMFYCQRIFNDIMTDLNNKTNKEIELINRTIENGLKKINENSEIKNAKILDYLKLIQDQYKYISYNINKKNEYPKWLVNFICCFIYNKKRRDNFRNKHIKISNITYNNKIELKKYNVGEYNKIFVLKNGSLNENYNVINGLDIVISGKNNVIILEEPFNFVGASIIINNANNCRIEIRKSKMFRWCLNFWGGDNSTFFIDSGSEITGPGSFQFVESCGHVKIGKDFLCAGNFIGWTHDGHSIIDINGKLLNYNKNNTINIGDHVWCGYDVKLTKNASVGSNSVIATGCVVAKKFTETNIIIGGNPAKILKRNINWDFKCNEYYIKED